MPNYDYRCPACGPFTMMRPMAEFHKPCACPDCGAEASRMVLNAPAVAGMDPARRSVLASSERDASHRGPVGAAHPAGCGCCVRRSPFPRAMASTGRIFTASGPLPGGGR